MIGALWTGISGLAAHQKALDNESHNIANVNTVGYKASRMSFADQMYQDKIGKGSKILDAEKIYTQGNLKVTGVSFDMALSGTGFFSVSNTRSSGTSETFYTRAGNFRMGDNGTLQDSAGNEVQGWAMTPIDAYVDVNSSNPNVSAFTTDYSKLIASKIVKHSSYIETVTAKATDYTLTAKADSSTVYAGYGLKTQSGKVADIEALINDYSNWLQKLKEEPDGSSSTSMAQVSTINLPDSGATGAMTKEGDQVYIYIDGNKISQNWDTDYSTTMKLFADKISAVPGLKAYTADSSNNASTLASDVDDGALRIESLIPGKAFSVTEAGMIASSTTTLGSYSDTVEAQAGSGIGALQSSMAALEKAIVGKQQDVYTPDDLGTLSSTAMTYQISIYDKDLQRNINVPTSPLEITASSVDNIVTAINANTSAAGELADYVKAYNINGNLVIKTLDSNADVEFTGTLKASYAVQEIQEIGLSSNTKEIQTVTLSSLSGYVEGYPDIISVEEKQNIEISIQPTQFNNNSFENGGDGWVVTNSVAQAGITTIAGFVMPDDNTYPVSNTAQTDSVGIMTYASSFQNNQAILSSNGDSANGYDVVRGPYMVSQDSVSILAGNSITVNWSAQGGGDAYDVFGYIINVNTGESQIIMNETGTSTTSTTVQSSTITVSEDGEYKFVFVSGSYDLSGGKALGATLNIQSVEIDSGTNTSEPLTDGPTSFLGTTVEGTAAGDTASMLQSKILADVDNIIYNWNNANPLQPIKDITAGTGTDLIVTFEAIAGDVDLVNSISNNNASFLVTDNTTGVYEIDTRVYVSFLGYNMTLDDGDSLVDLATAIDANKLAIINNWNSLSSNKKIESIYVDSTSNASAPTVTITYQSTEGDAPEVNLPSSGGVTFSEVETTKGGSSIGGVTFLGTQVLGSQTGDTTGQTANRIIAYKDNIISSWNSAHSSQKIANISLKNGTTDTLQIEYMGSEGDVSQTILQSSNGITFGASTQIVQGVLSGANSFVTIDRNADYSGREGAGAEFMQIVNRIDQTATKGSLQLRLDTLGISDSAFGEFAVDSTGLMTMQQDGAEFAIGQIAIALFNNERGLEPIGDNLLKATSSSGQPFYNINNDKTAKLESQTLELSTADLSESLVNLMVYQRAFEANAKSITTSDELLNTLINLKR